jgi:hypothetical protein
VPPGRPLTSDKALAAIENLLGLLIAGGIPPQDAAWACDVLMLIVTATAGEADVRRAAGLTVAADYHDIVEEMHVTFAGLPPERYPNVVAHAFELVTGDADVRFRFAIDTVLDGLVARSALGSRSPNTTGKR